MLLNRSQTQFFKVTNDVTAIIGLNGAVWITCENYTSCEVPMVANMSISFIVYILYIVFCQHWTHEQYDSVARIIKILNHFSKSHLYVTTLRISQLLEATQSTSLSRLHFDSTFVDRIVCKGAE